MQTSRPIWTLGSVVLLLVAAGCVQNMPLVPFAGTTRRTTIRGTRVGSSGDSIVAKVISYPSYIPIAPTGDKVPDAEITRFYLRRGATESALQFLTDFEHDGRSYELMEQILPVPETDRWVAFRMVDCRRDSIDVEIIMFDPSGIRKQIVVKNAIRVSLSAEGWKNIASYSIRQAPGSGAITIETSAGLLTYDGKVDQLTQGSANNSPDPTALSVTPAAAAPVAPAIGRGSS
jgi:hypothetical protein